MNNEIIEELKQKMIDFQNRVQVENQEDLKLIAEEKTQNDNFQTEKTEKNSKFSKNIQNNGKIGLQFY